jgi:hypothetical protein
MIFDPLANRTWIETHDSSRRGLIDGLLPEQIRPPSRMKAKQRPLCHAVPLISEQQMTVNRGLWDMSRGL